MDLITAIDKTRRDLLELSARNRLVHTPLETKKPGWIKIVDERSDQLFDILVRQNKAMTFLPQAADNAAAEVKEFRRAFDGLGDHESSLRRPDPHWGATGRCGPVELKPSGVRSAA